VITSAAKAGYRFRFIADLKVCSTPWRRALFAAWFHSYHSLRNERMMDGVFQSSKAACFREPPFQPGHPGPFENHSTEQWSSTMKKFASVLVCLMFLAVASASDGNDRESTVFGLTPVVQPFTGNANPIRNLGGGGVPWKITMGKAELDGTGKLEVHVTGLVLAGTGANPIANFAAILSCRSLDPVSKTPSIVNLVAGTAPATTTGDSEIIGRVTLPSPCIAPIVFVAIPATATAPARWLAASGF
jgi:hypothetical protein